uniref:Conserved hypothetical plastid protein n=1 Tax=Caulacanthus okamurae TaxID=152008 RepID=A0A6H1U796_9FLOR|nr:conserved hypothetical plastid protein [Caulacanthus okamurae]QIZ74721.1 conserved hypothetical plastid protein [Caulacanthus okamurae]
MTLITINSLVVWKSLPWKKINQRIFTLQEKIYKFSKQCDRKNIRIIQDYILNSSDAKLLAIQEICNNLNNYYEYNKKRQYKIEDVNKWHIYRYLFSNTENIYIQKFIIEYVKQFLVYLSLKPEWNAKLESNHKSNTDNISNCYLIYRLCNFFALDVKFNSKKLLIYSFYKSTIKKYINAEKLILKVQASKSISLYIKYWLNNQYFSDFSINYYGIHKFSDVATNNLNQLINIIIYNGIEWYLMSTLHTNIKICEFFNLVYLFYCNTGKLELYFKYNKQSTIILNSIEDFCSFLQIYNIDMISFYFYKRQRFKYETKVCSHFFLKREDPKNITKFHNYHTLYLHPSLYKQFIYHLKSFFYSYDFLGRLRKHKVVNLYKLFTLINNFIARFCKLYYPLINCDNFYFILKLSESTLIKLLKKDNKKLAYLYNNKNYLKYMLYQIK